MFIFFAVFQPQKSFAAILEPHQLAPAPIPSGKFLPLIIKVNNPGHEIKGKLIVRQTNSTRQNDSLEKLSPPVIQEVLLPQNSSLQFSIPVPVVQHYNYYFDTIYIELRSRNQILAQETLPVKYHQGPAVLIFSEYKKRFSFLTSIDLKTLINQQFTGKIFSVNYADLNSPPTDWRMLQDINVIIFDDFSMEKLLPETEDALVHWVLKGGNIIIFPETSRQYNSSNLLKRLKVDQTYSSSSNFSQKTLGNGNIILAIEVDGNWTKGEDIWKELFGKINITKKEFVLTKGISSKQSKRLTEDDFIILVFYFILFFILVGPVQYIYLKRKGNLHKLLPGTALCSIVFFSAFFILAAVRAGGKATLKQYSVFEIINGEINGPAVTFASYFSTTEKTLSVSSNLEQPVVLPLNYSTNQYYRHASSSNLIPQKIDISNGYSMSGIKIPTWNEEQFISEGIVHLKGPITIKQNNNILTVDNNSNLILHDCYYFSSGRMLYLTKTLPPGIQIFNLPYNSNLPPKTQTAVSYSWRWSTININDQFSEARKEMENYINMLVHQNYGNLFIARLEKHPAALKITPGKPKILNEEFMVIYL